MRGNAAARSENAFGRDHAAQIFGRSFDSGEDDFLATMRAPHGFLRAKDHVTGGRTRTGGQTAPDFFCVRYRPAIEDRREEMD